MPKFKIQHITKYTYEVPVRDSANQIMLYPIVDDFQEVIFHKITITGNPAIEYHSDVFRNRIGTFTHSQPHQELIIDSELEVNTKHKPLPDDREGIEHQWSHLENLQRKIPFVDFVRVEPFEHLSEIQQTNGGTRSQTPLKIALDLCQYVFTTFTYKKGITTVETTLDEIWKIKSGVCQDFAHILLALLRINKIPARYVSGYICPNHNGMRGEGATHAWVEVYIPFYGWLGLDPTNNCVANDNHVRLAIGKNFSDCSPVRGTYRGTSNHILEVAVSVGYESGEKVTDSQPQLPATSFSKNSYQRHQAMQMQQ